MLNTAGAALPEQLIQGPDRDFADGDHLFPLSRNHPDGHSPKPDKDVVEIVHIVHVIVGIRIVIIKQKRRSVQ